MHSCHILLLDLPHYHDVSLAVDRLARAGHDGNGLGICATPGEVLPRFVPSVIT